MRPRHPHLAQAHTRLLEWADWYGRMLTASCIGYPSRTGEARFREDAGVRSGKPAGALVPLVDIPRRLAAVDRAMVDLPDAWRAAVYAEAFPPEQGEPRTPAALYRHRTGRDARAFKRELDLALAWIAARLCEGRD